jgi:hypothetical protein
MMMELCILYPGTRAFVQNKTKTGKGKRGKARDFISNLRKVGFEMP